MYSLPPKDCPDSKPKSPSSATFVRHLDMIIQIELHPQHFHSGLSLDLIYFKWNSQLLVSCCYRVHGRLCILTTPTHDKDVVDVHPDGWRSRGNIRGRKSIDL